MAERLVVLAPEHADAVLAEISKRGRIVGRLPPRLAIVEIDDAQTEALRAATATEALIAVPGDPMPDTLTEAERLFAEAWSTRHQSKPKQRPGEGLPWDAEGFQPPDKPKHC
jgi:hypothetical protein